MQKTWQPLNQTCVDAACKKHHTFAIAVTACYTGWQPSFLLMGWVKAGGTCLRDRGHPQSAQLYLRIRSAAQLRTQVPRSNHKAPYLVPVLEPQHCSSSRKNVKVAWSLRHPKFTSLHGQPAFQTCSRLGSGAALIFHMCGIASMESHSRYLPDEWDKQLSNHSEKLPLPGPH